MFQGILQLPIRAAGKWQECKGMMVQVDKRVTTLAVDPNHFAAKKR